MATKIKSASAKNSVAAVRVSPQERQYLAREDLRTLQNAREISTDPKRVKAAQQEAMSQIAALKNVSGKK